MKIPEKPLADGAVETDQHPCEVCGEPVLDGIPTCAKQECADSWCMSEHRMQLHSRTQPNKNGDVLPLVTHFGQTQSLIPNVQHIKRQTPIHAAVGGVTGVIGFTAWEYVGAMPPQPDMREPHDAIKGESEDLADRQDREQARKDFEQEEP